MCGRNQMTLEYFNTVQKSDQDKQKQSYLSKKQLLELEQTKTGQSSDSDITIYRVRSRPKSKTVRYIRKGNRTLAIYPNGEEEWF